MVGQLTGDHITQHHAGITKAARQAQRSLIQLAIGYALIRTDHRSLVGMRFDLLSKQLKSRFIRINTFVFPLLTYSGWNQIDNAGSIHMNLQGDCTAA